MAEALRPRIAITSGKVFDVAVLRDGGYASWTSRKAIELFDATLAPRGTITGDVDGGTLVELDDGRLLLFRRSRFSFAEGRIGGTLTTVDAALGLLESLVPTPGGFLAIAGKGVLVDRGGTRTVVNHERRLEYGGIPWRGGAAVMGFDGLAILGPDGSELARSTDVYVGAGAVALANVIAVPNLSEIVVFDGAARVIARIPRRGNLADALVPYRDGVLVRSYDEDSGHGSVGFWQIKDGEAVERWCIRRPTMLDTVVVAGDR